MPEYRDLDQRQRRELREQAVRRMEYAWVASLLGGVLAIVLLAIVGFDTGQWDVFGWSLLSAGVTIALGYGTRRRSQLAAGALVILFIASAIVRLIVIGRLTSILFAAVFGYVYVQAFRATLDHAEYLKAEEELSAPTA